MFLSNRIVIPEVRHHAPVRSGDSVLVDFVEQSAIADVQESGCLFSVPQCCFQSPRNGIDLSLVFQRAQRRLSPESLVSPRLTGTLWRWSAVGPEDASTDDLVVSQVGSKFGYRRRLVAHDKVAFHKVFQFSQVARPRIAQTCLDQSRREPEGRARVLRSPSGP